MGMFAEECLWIGWRCLTVILAVALAAEIGQPHLKLGVAAQMSPALAPAAERLAGLFESQLNAGIKSIAKDYTDCFTEPVLEAAFDSDQITNALLQCYTDSVTTDLFSTVCQSEELGKYFADLGRMKAAGVRPNSNCSAGNWTQACDAGWAAVGLSNGTIPANTTIGGQSNSRPCCAGFFCPPGLTCMIPCPRGAYCPAATANTNFYNCYPYDYPSRPPGNHCGGADIWIVYKDSTGIFCGGRGDDQGTYCPDTQTQIVCEQGHFCRVGSTVQTKCKILGHCGKTGLKQENLRTYGILIVVLLTVSLLVIYTCSDQVLHIRERRKSKAREVAAREAKESVSAAERWKRAKETAKSAGKKAAIMFSGEVPRSLSRTVSKKPPPRSQSMSFRNLNVEIRSLSSDQDTTPELDPRKRPGRPGDEELGRREKALDGHAEASAGAVQGSSHEAWSHDLYPAEGPRSVDLYDAVQLSPVPSFGGFQKGDGLPAVKEMDDMQRPPKPLVHTRSQIYKYAYAEIEKEKTKQHSKHTSVKELVTTEGFDDMMLGPERFKMEISFVDLCLTLKGSRKKKILSFVTGKLSPSRMTAVMGPSGAGKTTFLNALAGKETGSVITGQVFINGVPGSIQAYRRIIGFVPQDDIVHGTLTVEENLNFSAKYRLPVDTPRQDRVLVVERIINRLNLTSVRESLVGTVENRGISGGQRKRVNVGLELVIEPSVLLLDEPTSGLDSTSSRLVVQSLRREAALGVNVCLVVHQPSYGLFKMFDDVLMLARGGYTVYLGPTSEMEAYFSTYGFEVPDRMNPPDYYMDVLEGVLMPDDNNQSFDLSSLPVLWMCHKGYHIPLELQRTADGRRMQQDDPLRLSHNRRKSLVHEVWDELRVWVLVRLDILEVAMSSVKNLSGRQTPGFFAQYFLILERVTKQRFRESRLVAQDYIILLLAGVCLGYLANWKDTDLGGQGYLYTLITVALLIMIASLRTFSSDKLQFWRESSSGVNRLAFFLAKDTVDHFNTLLKPAVYLSMFYFYNDPRSTFSSNYITTLALIYCCTGIAYIVGIVLKPQPAQLLCVFLPVLCTLVASEPHTGVLKTIERLTYAFWALQAYTIANAEKYTGVWLITRCALLRKYGYSINKFNWCIGLLMGYGVGARIVAFICLTLVHRKRQK